LTWIKAERDCLPPQGATARAVPAINTVEDADLRAEARCADAQAIRRSVPMPARARLRRHSVDPGDDEKGRGSQAL